MTRMVYLNKQLVPENQAVVSVFDRGFTHGDGLFETLRVKRGKAFRLKDHFERMTESAQDLLIPVPVVMEELQTIIKKLSEVNELDEAMVRIQLTRGECLEGLDLKLNTPPTLLITMKPYVPPPDEWIANGIKVLLTNKSATGLEILKYQVKSTSYQSNLMARHQANESGCQETVFVSQEGIISEGASSNIFLAKEGTLVTPSLNQDILPGITRKVIIECAKAQNIPIQEDIVTRNQLLDSDELFICNSRIGIIPVSEIREEKKRFSAPGPLTADLCKAYLNIVEAQC